MYHAEFVNLSRGRISIWPTILCSTDQEKPAGTGNGSIPAKHRILAIQRNVFRVSHEELRRVGVGPAIRHGHHSAGVVLHCQCLVVNGDFA